MALNEVDDVVRPVLTHTDYTRLMLTLGSELMVPIVPLWIDTSFNQLAVLAPAELAQWLEASLVCCSSIRNRLEESGDGFAVAATSLVLDLVSMPAFSLAADSVGWIKKGRWPHGEAPRGTARPRYVRTRLQHT